MGQSPEHLNYSVLKHCCSFFKLYLSFSHHCRNVRLSVSQMQQRRSSRPDEQFHYIPIICSHMMCHYLGNIHSSDRKGRT